MRITVIPGSKKELFHLLIRWTIIFILALTILFFSVSMPSKSYAGRIDSPTIEERELAGNLSEHVHYLADTIGIRTVLHYNGLRATEQYITQFFTSQGYSPKKQWFYCDGQKVCNIEIEIPGTTSPEEIIVIGAHYDTHLDTPGADDNGSGIASLLELARLFKDRNYDRTIRLVAFVNEEPPFYGTYEMGSLQYARRCSERRENIVAMFSLETLGYYTNDSGSQRYPFLFQPLLPDVGNFIAFVSNMRSRPITKRAVGIFRSNCHFPSLGLTPPGWITGIGWSDHWSFWNYGYKGVMITDTAPYRNRNYHLQSDTPEKLNYNYLARIVLGLKTVFTEFATNNK